MQLTRSAADQFHDQQERHAWLERATPDVIVWQSIFPEGLQVGAHRHSRCQLLHARSGVVLVKTQIGHWLVPSGHATWIPAGVEHAVDMLGNVHLQSVYVVPGAVAGLPASLMVVEMTDLARSLVEAAVLLPPGEPADARARHIHRLVLHEILRLREMPLGLPFPADRRMADLCRAFLRSPSSRITIDAWARALGMSRRTFTRRFHRETGLSLTLWRQQASLFGALPRLAEGETVTSVALDLGYESVAAFTTMFKRMLGKSPRAYLRLASGVNPPPESR